MDIKDIDLRDTVTSVRALMTGTNEALTNIHRVSSAIDESRKAMREQALRIKKSVEETVGEGRSALKKVENELKKLNAFNDRMAEIIGRPLAMDRFGSLNADEIPDLGLGDEEFAQAIVNALCNKSGIERLELLKQIVTEYVPTILGNIRKRDKLQDRINLTKGKTAEDNTAVVMRGKVENLIKVQVYRVKYLMSKFLETRRALMKRIYGVSEQAFSRIGGITIDDSIAKNKLDCLFDEFKALDEKYSNGK